MDNPIADLEQELRQLQPASLRPEFRARVTAELAPPETTAAKAARRRYRTATSWTSWKWANWSVAAVLVALLTVGTWLTPSANPERTEPAAVKAATVAAVDPREVYRPVRAARTLISSQPEGIVELDDGSPVERVRDYYVDTIEWQDAAGNAQLRWQVPREAVRFVALASY